MARICAAEAGGRTEGWPKKRTRLKMDRIFGPSCLLFGVPETDYPAGSLPRRQRRFPLAHGTVYPPQVRFHAPRVHRHLPCVPCDAPQVPRNVPHVHRHRTTGTAPPARSPPEFAPGRTTVRRLTSPEPRNCPTWLASSLPGSSSCKTGSFSRPPCLLVLAHGSQVSQLRKESRQALH